MRKVPTILLAVLIGVVIEAALGVISVASLLTGGIGPCGPTGDAPGFVRIIQRRGEYEGATTCDNIRRGAASALSAVGFPWSVAKILAKSNKKPTT